MSAEEEIALAGTRWDQAIADNDVEGMAAFMSDDWVIVGSDGITSKARFLEWIRSGTVTHHTMSSDEMQVRTYGDTGVLISRGTSAGTYQGEPFELYEWSTSVFIRQDDRWLCVSTMLTPAQKPASGSE